MNIRNFALFVVVLLSSAACGGGGGGGGGGNAPDYMTFNVSTVVATNVPGGDSVGATVQGTLSQQGQNKFKSGDNVYIVITHNSNAISNIDVQVFGTTGIAQIDVVNTLPVGTYNANLNVRVCKDAGCSRVVSSSNLPFRYDVLEPAVDVDDPFVLAFTQYQDQALPSDTKPYDFSRFALSRTTDIFLNLDTNTNRGDIEENAWVDISFDGDTITATTSTSALPCGQTTGEVIVLYETFEFSHDARIPIEYTINSLPVVHSVHPKAVYDAQSTDVIVAGCGFDSINASDLRIGGVAPTSATVVSDREMSVTIPAGLAAGYHDLTFTSAAAPVGSPTEQLLVKQAAARPTLEFDLNADKTRGSLLTLWDEERERLFVADPVQIALFQNTGTEWQYSPLGGVGGSGSADQILLSADGNTLASRSSSSGFSSSLQLYDAETFALLGGDSLDETRGGDPAAIDKFDRIYVSSSDSRASNYMVFSLDGYLLRDDFGSSPRTSIRAISVASGNKDIVLVSTTKTDGWIRIDTTDDSELFQSHTDSTGANRREAWVSYTGAYAEIRNNELGLGRAIFDASFAFVGRIPDVTNFDDQVQAVRTSGIWIDEATNTAIASFSEPTQSGVAATRVRYELYDLTSATNDPFVATGSVEMTGTFNAGVDDKEENHFLVSDDGETIFRIGDRITIMPNPF